MNESYERQSKLKQRIQELEDELRKLKIQLEFELENEEEGQSRYSICSICDEVVDVDIMRLDENGNPICIDCPNINICNDCNGAFTIDEVAEVDGNLICMECNNERMVEC